MMKVSYIYITHMTKFIVIDGSIGAGKTTVITDVLIPILAARGIRAKVITEPVDLWKQVGILQEFYRDQKRFSYEFQTFAYVTRIKECIKTYKELLTDPVDFVFMERSIFSDKHVFVKLLHDDGMIDAMHMAMYNEWWNMWNMLMPFTITGSVYIRPTPEICEARCKKRARDGEEGIPLEYFQKLHGYYEKYYSDKKDVFITDGKDVLADSNKFIDDVLKGISLFFIYKDINATITIYNNR